MSDALPPARSRSARRVAFPPNWPARIALAALALYVVYASSVLDITWARFVAGLRPWRTFPLADVSAQFRA